jgi:hypothetical protein
MLTGGAIRAIANRAMTAVDRGEMAELLRRKGWKEIKNVSHCWVWRKPPLPALYQIRDAYDLEMARAKGRRSMGNKNPLIANHQRA